MVLLLLVKSLLSLKVRIKPPNTCLAPLLWRGLAFDFSGPYCFNYLPALFLKWEIEWKENIKNVAGKEGQKGRTWKGNQFKESLAVILSISYCFSSPPWWKIPLRWIFTSETFKMSILSQNTGFHFILKDLCFPESTCLS